MFNDLRCYCCGKDIGASFYLVSPGKSTVDRVFVMLPEHVERVEKPRIDVLVRRERRPPIRSRPSRAP